MNKLTKSELIIKLCGRSKVKLKPDSHIDAYNEGVRACLDFIGDTEIIPDPVPAVDTELEEAKKLVGTWVKASYAGDDLFLIKKVKRDPSNWDLDLFSDTRKINIKACTPATLPTAALKWRCMKTDVPEDCNDMLMNLNGSYHLGGYLRSIERWSARGVDIDLSCYETALWLEIQGGE